MLPDEFNEQIIKMEAGELSGEEIERLKAAAAERPEAGRYLESIERAMASAAEALNAPPPSNDSFAENVMIAVRREQSASGFRMQMTPRARKIRLQRRLLFVLTLFVSCVILYIIVQTTINRTPTSPHLPAVVTERIGSIAPVGDGAVIIEAAKGGAEHSLQLRTGIYPGDSVKSGNAYLEATLRISPQASNDALAAFNRGASAVFTGRDALTLNAGTLFINRGPDDSSGIDYRISVCGVDVRVAPRTMAYLSVTFVEPDAEPVKIDSSSSSQPPLANTAGRIPTSSKEKTCVIICSVYNGVVRAISPAGEERLIRERESVRYSQSRFVDVETDRFRQLDWYDDMVLSRD